MCCLHIDTPGAVDIFIFIHLTGATFCDIMISQMRMGTNGHNNTLWRFIVPYHFSFVNDFFQDFSGDRPGFFILSTKHPATLPYCGGWISLNLLSRHGLAGKRGERYGME